MLKTFEILLDVEKELYTPSNILFSVSRNDLESIELQFFIRQDDAPVNLENTIVELAIKKPSGKTAYLQCNIVDTTAGKAAAKLSLQSYVEFGLHTAEIYIRNSTQLIVTSPFYFVSRESIMQTEEIESINDWSALQQALFAYDLKPILTESYPTAVPEYVGQMAFDSLNKIVYIASDLTVISWQAIIGGGGEGGNDTLLLEAAPANAPARIGQIAIDTLARAAYIATGATAADWEQIDLAGVQNISWLEIEDKPAAFPPETHNHEITEINGLQTALDGKADDIDLAEKADINHTHSYTTLTDIPLAFPPEAHAHDEYLTQAEGDLRYAVKGEGGGTVAPAEWGTITGNITAQTDLQAALAEKADDADLAAKADINHTHSYTTLTDIPAVFAPAAHDHTIAEVTGLQTALDGKANNADLAAKANTADVYNKIDVYNKTEVDEIVTGITEGGGTVVTDSLISTSTTAALAANQGRILNETKADIDHTHSYTALTDIPTTFTPTAHDHTIAEITDLQAALDGKADDADLIPFITEAEADLKYSLKVDAPVEHGHTIQQIEGLQAEIDTINAEIDTKADINHTHSYTILTDIPTTFAPSAHNHTIAEVTGLQTALDSKADDIDLAGKADINHTHSYTTLTDIPTTFTPTAHDHTIAEVTGLQTALNGKADDADLAAKADAIHTHTIANITGLQAALDGKADDADLAEKADVNHTHAYTSLTDIPTTFAPAAHDHTIAEVTGLQTALDGKADDADLDNYQKRAAQSTAAPTTTPEYIGQITVNTLDKRTYIAEGTTANDWRRLAGTNYADAGDNHIEFDVLNGNKIWTGTQAAYDGLAKDAKTLYFITG